MSELLPILNLNTLESKEECIKLEKDTVNFTSVDIADKIIEALLSGFINPLEFAVKRKLVTDALDMAMKNPHVKSMMMEEIEKYGKDGASAMGARIYIFSKPLYQYEKDPTWKSMKDALAPFENSLKEQEKKIQSACKNNCSLMGDGGELIASIVPAPCTQSVAVSFSKK